MSMECSKLSIDSDPTSCANLCECRVQHMKLRWTVDFDKSLIRGNVVLDVKFYKKSAHILLDAKALSISRVSDVVSGADLKYTCTEYGIAQYGMKLDIDVGETNPNTVRCIRIEYSTTKDCTGLQFLTAQQTADKKHAYVFSQCQAIHARSIVPCMDTPAVKQTYSAMVSVPDPLVALMSAVANNKPVADPDLPTNKIYSYEQKTEKFLQGAIDLLGEYVWGRYDILVLPPSFPFGGMENPCLTFATPTLLAGDRSLSGVLAAHEIAHSWTGNLVTNATFEHFWLNEGHTTFAERKICGKIFKSEAFRNLEAVNCWKGLEYAVNEQLGPTHPFTKMVPNLAGGDPEEAFSTVPYEKGHALLFTLEKKLGGPAKFEPFLKAFINKFKYQSIVTDQWKAFLYEFFADQKAVLDTIDWDTWFYKAGLPPNPGYDDCMVVAAHCLAESWSQATDDSAKSFTVDDYKALNVLQQIEFLAQLGKLDPLSHAKVEALQKLYALDKTKNFEIKFQDLNGWDVSKEKARQLFVKNRACMHPATAALVAKDLEEMEGRECVCIDGEGAGCTANNTCYAGPGSACFHSMKEIYENGKMHTMHIFGCLPPEAGGSALQCHGHLSPHHTPQTIACCFEGDFCNENLQLEYRFIPTTSPSDDSGDLFTKKALILCAVAVLLVVSIFVMLISAFLWRRRQRTKNYLKNILIEDSKRDPLLSDKKDLLDEMSSGSGSGRQPSLEVRTACRDLNYGSLVGQGRYGKVFEADFKGDKVAVKEFFSYHEDSWKREKEIYATPLIHPNILRFIIADITFAQSQTKMIIVSEFHPHGSLHDFLKSTAPLNPISALKLAISAASGLHYLHQYIAGDGGYYKPAIAHRDVKSKNIMVKNREECCIGDFGLAVTAKRDWSVDPDFVSSGSSRVGTKRYMAPELLDESFNAYSFEAYTQVDMYAFALVLWEIARRAQEFGETYDGGVLSRSDMSGIGSSVVSSTPSDPLTQDVSEESGNHSWSTASNSSAAFPYQCPFDDVVPSDPSFDLMKQIVCDQRKRPPVDPRWEKEGTVLQQLSRVMDGCWKHEPEARYNARYVKRELERIMKKLQEGYKSYSNATNRSIASTLNNSAATPHRATC